MFDNKYDYQSDFAGYTCGSTSAKPARQMPTSIWAATQHGPTQGDVRHSQSRVSSRLVIRSGNQQEFHILNTQTEEFRVSSPASIRKHDWTLPHSCNRPVPGLRSGDKCSVRVTSSQFLFNFHVSHISGLDDPVSFTPSVHGHATVPTYNDLSIQRKRPLSNSCVDGRPQRDLPRLRRHCNVARVRSQLMRAVAVDDPGDPMDIDPPAIVSAQDSRGRD